MKNLRRAFQTLSDVLVEEVDALRASSEEKYKALKKAIKSRQKERDGDIASLRARN